MRSPEEMQQIRRLAQARALHRIDTPEAETTKWWWLSFADGRLPEGEQFLGAAVVAADDLAEATVAAHLRGINPGGEIQAVEFGQDEITVMGRANFDFMLNSLRSRDEIVAQGIEI